jgi:hypothetical protein
MNIIHNKLKKFSGLIRASGSGNPKLAPIRKFFLIAWGLAA